MLPAWYNGVSRLSILGKFNMNWGSWSHTMFLRLDVGSVRVLMFIFQHFFQGQEFWSWTEGVAKPLSLLFPPLHAFEYTQWFKFHKQW